MADTLPELLWSPDQARIDRSRMHDFMQWLERERGMSFADYQAMWHWSVEQLEDFWAAIWEYFGVISSTPYSQVLDSERMPGACWFGGARVNFCEQLFRFYGQQAEQPAIISRSELRPLQQLSWGELKQQIASFAHGLRQMGVGPGDRVVAYLPNIPEAVVAFYACASIGAVWSSCSPDMGSRSVIDRFKQIEPRVMLAVDGYRYGGKDFDRLEVVQELTRELDTLEQVVLLPYLNMTAELSGSVLWQSMLQYEEPMSFAQLAFDHPLWVVYSSGTTGMPKPIVHGHGGALLEGLKGYGLHMDLQPDDRYLWFTTTGWIMWNAQISGLLLGATICLFDGNPGYPDLSVLWKFAGEAGVSFFGAGAAFHMNCKKAGVELEQLADLSAIRTVGSTGSPLPEEGYRWLMAQLGSDVLVAALSGGTDIATSYVGPCPIEPLYAGEMQCRYLGTAVYAFDDAGKVLEDGVGELVVTRPMPCMPLYFWGDIDGQRYHDSYFETFPGIWRHGDWIRMTRSGGAIIYGRSDTTINRHGIRLGTAEIYRVVEDIPEVLDSLVVDLEYLEQPSWLPLFVVLRADVALTEELQLRIQQAIRTLLSARHVPDEIVQVAEIPRTLTGKKMELPVKKLLQGKPLSDVANPDAMANPASLAIYTRYAAQRNLPVLIE
jgi:acetoacetyl-CoA synthetase